MKTFALPLILTGLASLATARTVLSGCTSSETRNQWGEASMIWWVPDTGEICDFPDCGGGRAPPKTTQPGCPLYSGTATLTPSYMPGWGPNGKLAATASTVSSTATSLETTTPTAGQSALETGSQTESASGMVTAAPTSSPVVSLTTTTSAASQAGNSTSSAATAVHTGGANGIAATNLAGVMAIVAAAVGVVAL